jgi:hypothetical protein
MKTRHLKFVAMGFVSAGLMLAAVGVAGAANSAQAPAPAASGSYHDSYHDVRVTPAEAIVAVKAMLDKPQSAGLEARPELAKDAAAVGVSDLTATGPFSNRLYSYYDIEGADVSAIVDAHDGHVSQLLIMSLIPSSGARASISGSEAEAIASSYLSDHEISTEEMTVQVQLRDRGAMQEYVVSWQRVVNGAVVPDSRLVRLDAATGVIFAIHNVSRPYTAPANPAVGKDEAISIAQAAVTKSTGRTLGLYRVLDATLGVTFGDKGDQQLAWTIELGTTDPDSPASCYKVTVDADSGIASIIGMG